MDTKPQLLLGYSNRGINATAFCRIRGFAPAIREQGSAEAAASQANVLGRAFASRT